MKASLLGPDVTAVLDEVHHHFGVVRACLIGDLVDVLGDRCVRGPWWQSLMSAQRACAVGTP